MDISEWYWSSDGVLGVVGSVAAEPLPPGSRILASDDSEVSYFSDD